ncbi:peptidase c26 family protein [Stylonychia lemnae]|uniref:folate gamma-glutamyl hydrolase n=1 Tax=Stylonychia lemnae TaxID=5949 RepID=A0A078A6Y3_STYLE|nr:peptidase c26 family protein [Stylonychia lemnae]|eukprot:CDW77999.1 peptidase c26 family protein [Stylonychia lemnae]
MLALITVGVILAQAMIVDCGKFNLEVLAKKFTQTNQVNYVSPTFSTVGTNGYAVIAVVAPPLEASQISDARFAGQTTYIMQSYINFIEGAGARTVPLVYTQDLNSELAKLADLNGVLIPGNSNSNPDYEKFVKAVLDRAKQICDAGKFLPVLGIAEGLTQIAQWAANKDASTLLTPITESDSMKSLTFVNSGNTYKMFQGLGDKALIYQQSPLTYFDVKRALLPAKFTSGSNLNTLFRVTSTFSANGQQFVASLEGKSLPFFAVQFNVDRPQYLFTPQSTRVDHSYNAIYYNRFFADQFVNYCRRNKNVYDNAGVELTENFKKVFTSGKEGLVYTFPQIQ